MPCRGLQQLACLAALVTGCTGRAELPENAGGADTSAGDITSDDGPETTTTGTTRTTSGSSSTGDPSLTDGASSTGVITSAFIIAPDGGGARNECSTWEEDCPRGHKCMPWANDGGSSWNATTCSPIAPDPDQPGEACTVEESGVSGVDSCDLHSMCWDVDGRTNLGTCVPMCAGTPNVPTCDDPNRQCTIASEGFLNLCFPLCDPLAQDCPRGAACYTFDLRSTCAPDASGEQGGYGDPCEFVNACDPGLSCEDQAATPGCTAARCCTPYCDLNAPNTCPGEGQECLGDVRAPRTLDHVGICGVP